MPRNTVLETEMESVLKALTDKYPELELIVVAREGSHVYVQGNMCIVCGEELLEEYIELTGTTHSGTEPVH